MFHEDCPKGKIFMSNECEALEEDGWVDTPSRLNLPEDNTTDFTEEQVEKMQPKELITILEGYGFLVMTQEQLQAQANQMVAGALDIGRDELKIEHLPDEDIIHEVHRRKLDDGKVESMSDEELMTEVEARGIMASDKTAENDLQHRFDEDPTSLNKDELIALGNNVYSLGLRSNFKEDTLIEKITDAMNKGN